MLSYCEDLYEDKSYPMDNEDSSSLYALLDSGYSALTSPFFSSRLHFVKTGFIGKFYICSKTKRAEIKKTTINYSFTMVYVFIK
jgi:hypothetical protein